MNRKRQGGYTLIEIFVVIGIMGILAATALPFYRTWQARGVATEARIMVKQIMDAEIGYNLDHSTFFPVDSDTIEVWNDDLPNSDNIIKISRYLNVDIIPGHHLDYFFTVDRSDPLAPTFQLEIDATIGSNIFGDSDNIIYILDNKGIISAFY